MRTGFSPIPSSAMKVGHAGREAVVRAEDLEAESRGDGLHRRGGEQGHVGIPGGDFPPLAVNGEDADDGVDQQGVGFHPLVDVVLDTVLGQAHQRNERQGDQKSLFHIRLQYVLQI